jgi:diguanylate cyclase (GGDEF)-like protein
MPLDYNSLLLAIGFAGAGLAISMFGSWLAQRTEGFLLTWAIGVGLVVAHVFALTAYIAMPMLVLAVVAFGLLTTGFSFLFGAARQFRTGRLQLRDVALLAGLTTAALVPPAAFGLDGLIVIIANYAASLLLLLTGHQHWLGRQEAPAANLAIAALYAVTGVSFALCATVLVVQGNLVLGGAPSNWAEDVNLIVSIVGITGIGALSLALNQSRLARSHRQDAMTDQLTGLMNRRALFKQAGATPVDRFTAVMVFDLDRFKSVNDDYGHSVGDEVLRRFALVMTEGLRGNDVAARLGGEEFAAVLSRTTTERAHQIAERIRREFGDLAIATEKGELRCTVSVGIAFPTTDLPTFEQVLGDADKALYRAKNTGRNRVATNSLRLAG